MRIVFAVLLLSLLGCAGSGPMVNTTASSNPDKDFAAYQTFGFLQPLSTDRANGARTFTSAQLMSSMRNELEARGLREDPSPELLVNFYIALDTRLRVERVPTASSFHHYRRGRYNQWMNYQTVTTQYTRGTLAIDFIDAASNVLAWEAAADGRMRQNLSEFTQEQVDAIVAEVMKEFPVLPVSDADKD